MTHTDTAYASDIVRSADNPHSPTAAHLRAAQAAMWARHRINAWQSAPLAALTAQHVARGTAARARTQESRI